MADCGIGSRRNCEELIRSGRVCVDGKICSQPGITVNDASVVTFDGEVITPVANSLYIALNKPVGYVTTVNDQFGRKTVLDLLSISERVFPVGRLDYNTEGLLLLTNDGSFAYKLTHPKHEIYKTYVVKVEKPPVKDTVKMLEGGVILDKVRTYPCKITQNGDCLTVSIKEGRNRQIRRMFELAGHPVVSLKRVAIGALKLNGLKPGEYRFLSEEEVRSLL
jgi:pseudouridine synthase